jgi:hypothetical protein
VPLFWRLVQKLWYYRDGLGGPTIRISRHELMDWQTLAWRRIAKTFGILKTFDTSLLSRTTYFFAEFSLVAMIVSVACHDGIESQITYPFKL